MGNRYRLHCYAAAFGHDFAAATIDEFSNIGDTILDPFAGSGTALLQAAMLKRHPIGIDVDPIACLISTVSTSYYDAGELQKLRIEVRNEVQRLISESTPACRRRSPLRAGDSFRLNGYVASVPAIPAIDYWFADNHKFVLAGIIQIAKRIRNRSLRNIVHLSLSSAIIRKWPNTISQAMDVDHSRPHRVRPARIHLKSIYELFLRVFEQTISIIERISKCLERPPQATVIQGDAVQGMRTLRGSTVDLVFTSPPYVGAIDYPRAHKFAEWWLPKHQAKQICVPDNYFGLRKARESAEATESHCKSVLNSSFSDLQWVNSADRAYFVRLCQYVCDMNCVAMQLKRVLKPGKPLLMVLANNRLRGRTVPVVATMAEILHSSGFRTIEVRRRSIKSNRRRYPFDHNRFQGPMKTEQIIEARV